MAHFAKLDSNNVVIDVIVLNNQELLDPNGIEREELGIAFLIMWSGGHANWRQTSYNKNFRGNFAGTGYTYDPAQDVFIPPKPYASWVLDTTIWQWKAPIDKPQDPNKLFGWDESIQNWVVTDSSD